MTKAMTISLLPHLKINILFFPLLATSILGKYFSAFALAFLCAILHELSHVFAAWRMGVGVLYIEILPFGICARLKSDIIKNPVCEILIALSGPFTNIIISAASLVFKYKLSSTSVLLDYFTICNLSMAIINLLPCLPLDGGRMLRAYLTLKTGAVFAYNFTVKLSRIIVLILVGGSVYLLLSNNFNFSLILIGAFLLGNLCLEQRNATKNTLRELLFYEDKLKTGEMTLSNVITAHKSTPARRILKKLSYNNYHIICVVDDDLSVTKALTEGQVINALTKQSIRITLGEI